MTITAPILTTQFSATLTDAQVAARTITTAGVQFSEARNIVVSRNGAVVPTAQYVVHQNAGVPGVAEIAWLSTAGFATGDKITVEADPTVRLDSDFTQKYTPSELNKVLYRFLETLKANELSIRGAMGITGHSFNEENHTLTLVFADGSTEVIDFAELSIDEIQGVLTRLTAVEMNDGEQDRRLTAIEGVDTAQDALIAKNTFTFFNLAHEYQQGQILYAGVGDAVLILRVVAATFTGNTDAPNWGDNSYKQYIRRTENRNAPLELLSSISGINEIVSLTTAFNSGNKVLTTTLNYLDEFNEAQTATSNVVIDVEGGDAAVEALVYDMKWNVEIQTYSDASVPTAPATIGLGYFYTPNLAFVDLVFPTATTKAQIDALVIGRRFSVETPSRTLVFTPTAYSSSVVVSSAWHRERYAVSVENTGGSNSGNHNDYQTVLYRAAASASSGGGGSMTFEDLTDTPRSLRANSWLKVNSAGDQIVFTDDPEQTLTGLAFAFYNGVGADDRTETLAYDSNFNPSSPNAPTSGVVARRRNARSDRDFNENFNNFDYIKVFFDTVNYGILVRISEIPEVADVSASSALRNAGKIISRGTDATSFRIIKQTDGQAFNIYNMRASGTNNQVITGFELYKIAIVGEFSADNYLTEVETRALVAEEDQKILDASRFLLASWRGEDGDPATTGIALPQATYIGGASYDATAGAVVPANLTSGIEWTNDEIDFTRFVMTARLQMAAQYAAIIFFGYSTTPISGAGAWDYNNAEGIALYIKTGSFTSGKLGDASNKNGIYLLAKGGGFPGQIRDALFDIGVNDSGEQTYRFARWKNKVRIWIDDEYKGELTTPAGATTTGGKFGCIMYRQNTTFAWQLKDVVIQQPDIGDAEEDLALPSVSGASKDATGNLVLTRRGAADQTITETKKDIFISPTHNATVGAGVKLDRDAPANSQIDIAAGVPTPSGAIASVGYRVMNIAILHADWDACHKIEIYLTHATTVYAAQVPTIYKGDLGRGFHYVSGNGIRRGVVSLFRNQTQTGTASTTTHRLQIEQSVHEAYIDTVRLVSLTIT